MEHTVPAALATVLRKTSLNELLVLASLAAVLAIVIPSLYRKVRAAGHNWVFWGLSAAIVIASGLLFSFRTQTFDTFCGEGHVVEWLTAHLLLIAGVVGIVTMFRLRARRKAFPLTVFLTTGCLVAFCRELQWGEPFFGEKIIYTRYMWRPGAYFNASHFRELAGESEMIQQGITEQFLHGSFLVFMVLIIVVGAVTISYFVRHRKLLAEQSRAFFKAPAGRLFIAGVGLFLAAQLSDEIVEELFEDQLAAMGTSSCVMAEPLELIASMLLVRSMVRLWHMERCYLPAAAVR